MDMSNMPVVLTKYDITAISRKIRITDDKAPHHDAKIQPRIQRAMECEQKFLNRCASHISTLTGLFTSRAFLEKIVSDFQAAKNDLSRAFTQPSTDLTVDDDCYLLAVCRHMEKNPDDFVKAGFTRRQQKILAHRMTQQMELQPQYLSLMRETRICSL